MSTVDREKVQQVRTILGKQEVLRNICIATSGTEMGACLEWKPKTQDPEFPSMTEMLGRVEEDPQSRTLAFFRVLTRTPSVGECTRSMHTLT